MFIFLLLHGYVACLEAVKPVLQQHQASQQVQGPERQQQQLAQTLQRDSDRYTSAEHSWLPAKLAPLVPAPVCRLLQQLGYSRELVLWGACNDLEAPLTEDTRSYELHHFHDAFGRCYNVVLDTLWPAADVAEHTARFCMYLRDHAHLLSDVMLHWATAPASRSYVGPLTG
jgi:hypothetical protein